MSRVDDIPGILAPASTSKRLDPGQICPQPTGCQTRTMKIYPVEAFIAFLHFCFIVYIMSNSCCRIFAYFNTRHSEFQESYP